MQIQKLKLQSLKNLDPDTLQQFVHELETHGFAIVQTADCAELEVIHRTLTQARTMKTFRFPKHGEPVEYTENKRESFRQLFETSQICLRALLHQINPTHELSKQILETIEGSNIETALFPPNGTGHTPFPNDTDFSSSFYNIFNYNYGLLNHHKDRYLVTVVSVDTQKENAFDSTNKTALWAKSPSVGWVNIDGLLQKNDFAIFTGEEFEALTTEIGSKIPAVLHCTRVDPTGPRLPKYENQPDPKTAKENNRVSMAFVLSDAIDSE